MTIKTPPSQLSTLNHIALKVRDLAACTDFYHGILGLELIERQQNETGAERAVWFRLADGILMLERQEEGTKASIASEAGWHLLALTIPETSRDQWKDYLSSHDISIAQESAYSLYFRDPEGNRVALSHFASA